MDYGSLCLAVTVGVRCTRLSMDREPETSAPSRIDNAEAAPHARTSPEWIPVKRLRHVLDRTVATRPAIRGFDTGIRHDEPVTESQSRTSPIRSVRRNTAATSPRNGLADQRTGVDTLNAPRFTCSNQLYDRKPRAHREEKPGNRQHRCIAQLSSVRIRVGGCHPSSCNLQRAGGDTPGRIRATRGATAGSRRG